MVVVVVVGILAAISGANYSRMRNNAKMAACILHQRGVYEAALVYALDFDVADGAMNVGVLLAAGLVGQDICECPSSDVEDFDDYSITWVDGLPTEVDCDVQGGLHDWEP
jgi:hypothetical protein